MQGSRWLELFWHRSNSTNARILVLAGGGNNGGDGFVIARKLADANLDVVLCLLVNPDHVKGDARVHLDVYRKRELPLFFNKENEGSKLERELAKADVIVDAILGTGVHGPVREPLAGVIRLVNRYAGEKRIVAVDIPTGLNSDDGVVTGGVAVRADETITFVLPKRGFFLNQGPRYIGNWRVVDISVPLSIVDRLELRLPQLITRSLAAASVPDRPSHGHKGMFGHVLVVGGSRQYVGAPVFTARAALHSGAGLVTLAIPESVYRIAASQVTESLFLPLPEEDGHFSRSSLAELIPKLQQFNCVAVGPGMSRFEGGGEWLRTLLASLEQQTLVIDADALYLLRNDLERLRQYKGPVIMTPHPGEMGHLLNKPVRDVEENRLDLAADFAKKYQVYLLLKGHRSVIAAPNGDVFVNPHGHDALGKGGSGDVLTGMIAAFIAQGASPVDALVAASYYHAKAGEGKAKELSHYGVMPQDLIQGIREQLSHLC